jgi:prophage antirepressor-like protein
VFEGHAVRTVVKDGEVWFVAVDVCAVLGLRNSRQALARLDNDEKGVQTLDTLGGPQEFRIINEFGLYTLVLGSRKIQARAFGRWVTHEVIPAIRRTGHYDATDGMGATSQALPPSDDAGLQEYQTLDHEVTLTFTEPGRYSVTIAPDGRYHSFRSDFGAIVQEHDRVTIAILCHQIQTISLLWHQMQLLQSVQIDPAQGHQRRQLVRAIWDAGQMSKHHLGVIDQQASARTAARSGPYATDN